MPIYVAGAIYKTVAGASTLISPVARGSGDGNDTDESTGGRKHHTHPLSQQPPRLLLTLLSSPPFTCPPPPSHTPTLFPFYAVELYNSPLISLQSLSLPTLHFTQCSFHSSLLPSSPSPPFPPSLPPAHPTSMHVTLRSMHVLRQLSH